MYLPQISIFDRAELAHGEVVVSNECPNCAGTGYVVKIIDVHGVASMRTKCPDCRGTGQSGKAGVEVAAPQRLHQ